MHDNNSWQEQLKTAVISNTELAKLINIKTLDCKSDFKFKAPLAFIKKIKHNDINDPLLLQILIQEHENIQATNYIKDPLFETKHNFAQGIIHKYKNRALVTLSGGCAINCRYCFRRHFNYNANNTNLNPTSPAYNYLKQNNTINEVILSGGDPLLQNDTQLKKILTNLSLIPHLKIVRIHTRLPIVIPCRITDELPRILTSTRLKPIIVVHCNHANELAEDTKLAFQKLSNYRIPILNQSVLLKNINDSSRTLITLSHKLFEQGVLPYYLHILDQVAGSQHFAVDHANILAIQHDLLTELPGYLVPKIVKDGMNKKFKTPL